MKMQKRDSDVGSVMPEKNVHVFGPYMLDNVNAIG